MEQPEVVPTIVGKVVGLYMFFVYILKSEKKDQLYIGQTNNLSQRLYRHNAGHVPATKGRGPWRIIYKQVCRSRSESIKYERYLKSLKNKSYIRKIIYSGVEQPDSSPGP